MTDEEVAIRVNEYMKLNKYALRRTICNACHTSEQRILRLVEKGLVDYFPPPANNSIAGKLGRKRSTWGNFVIRRTS